MTPITPIVPLLDIGDLLTEKTLLELGAIPVSLLPGTTGPSGVTYTNSSSTQLGGTSSSITSLQHGGTSTPAMGTAVATGGSSAPTNDLSVTPGRPTSLTENVCLVQGHSDISSHGNQEPNNPFPTGPRFVTSVVNVRMVVNGDNPRPEFVVPPEPLRKRRQAARKSVTSKFYFLFISYPLQ